MPFHGQILITSNLGAPLELLSSSVGRTLKSLMLCLLFSSYLPQFGFHSGKRHDMFLLWIPSLLLLLVTSVCRVDVALCCQSGSMTGRSVSLKYIVLYTVSVNKLAYQ